MKLDTIDYIPKTVHSRKGSKKELYIKKQKSYFILDAKKCRKKAILPNIIYLNKGDIISIGLYLAEGHRSILHHNGEIDFTNSDKASLNFYCSFLEKFNIKRTDLRWSVDININFKDKIPEKEISDYWINKLNLNPNSKRRSFLRYRGNLNGKLSKNSSIYGCLRLSYASVVFRGYFLYLINKLFSEFIKNKNKKNLSYILRGYFAGDGNVYKGRKPINKWTRQLEFACNDLTLRNKLRDALKILGLISIKEADPINTKAHTHALRVYNYHDFRLLDKYDIPNLVDHKKEIFQEIINSYSKHL